MKKRAQLIPIFVMLALFLILSLSLMYYFLSGKTTNEGTQEISASFSLDTQTTIIKSIIQDCLEEKTAVAVDKFCGSSSSSQACVEQYIMYYFNDCFDPATLRSKGIDIVTGLISARALINYDSVLVDMEYPITLSLKDRTSKFSNFRYLMPLSSTARPQLDSNERTIQEIRMLSQDQMAELVIPAGTKITSRTGQPVVDISVRIADKHESGLSNNAVMSTTIYDFQPEGVVFEPAVTIKLKYIPEMLVGMYESDLKIGWYDYSAGFWKGLPSSHVDVVNKVVSAQLSHFTKIGVVSCTKMDPEADTDVIKFNYTNIIKKSANTDEGCTCSCDKNCLVKDIDLLAQEGMEPMGYFTFTIPSEGNGCVMEKAAAPGEADIKVELLCSAGDNCAETDFSASDTFKDLTSKVYFNPPPTPDVWTDGGLVAGENTVYFSLKDKDGDGCSWAKAKVEIRGNDKITYPNQTCDSSDSETLVGIEGCTVQDAINILCGKDDPVYNDIYPGIPNCERDSKGSPIGFLDPARESKLTDLISAAQAVDSACWRPVMLAQLSNPSKVLSDISSLGLTLSCMGAGICGGGGGGGENSVSGSPVDSCHAQGGVLVDSMGTCDSQGGWPISSSDTGGQVCCKTQGCCVAPDDTLTDSEKKDCVTVSDNCGENILTIAESTLGHPYVLGAPEWNPASLPAEGAAIDCSAYTKWVYNRYESLNNKPSYHITSRNAQDQARDNGRIVDHDPMADWGKYETIKPDCAKLQKGDLLFFYNPADAGIAHVGIYYGNCKMIHAGDSTGGVSIVEDLMTYNAYGNHYIGAKRLCPDSVQATTPGQGADQNIFVKDSCSNLEGCCTWDSDTQCYKAVTKSTCDHESGATFHYDDLSCSQYPQCDVQEVSSGAICAEAEKYIGCNYISSGSTSLSQCKQSGQGYTCATFVHQITQNVCGNGVYGDGYTKCAQANVEPVSSGDLQPGDIFSYGPDYPGHTGFYCGDGYIIHANSITWTVAKTKLEEWYSMDPKSKGMQFCRVSSCANS